MHQIAFDRLKQAALASLPTIDGLCVYAGAHGSHILPHANLATA